jgi:hypothetical protein
MRVAFHKTGERRYRVSIARELGPDLTCVNAPGYDARLPHDLLHLVAEIVWEMQGGVFASLATTEDTGAFFPEDPALVAKWMRRRRRRPLPKPKGRRSELLADVLERAWKHDRLGAPLPAGWDARLSSARADGPRLRRALAWCDDLAREWQALPVGGTLVLEWPWPESRPVRRRAARGRPAARRASAGGTARRGGRS